jgi:hypothetical protein
MTDEHIDKLGRSLIAVMPTLSEPEFTGFIYTVGNTGSDLPELLIIGTFNPEHTGRLLNEISDNMLVTGEIPPVGLLDMSETGWRMPVMVRKASDRVKVDYTVKVGDYYATSDYEVLQILIPDTEGKYAGQGAAEGFEVELV